MKKKIKYKRRVLVYTLLSALIVFSILDYHFETAGVPDFIKEDIRSRFRRRGLELTFDDAKCGLFNGLVLSNPSCASGDPAIYPSISATSIVLRPRVSLSSKYLLAVDSIEIHGGRAVFPLFPESGVEGAHDVLEFREIEGMLEVDGNALNFAWLTGKFKKLKVSIAGRIENVFSPKIAKWFSLKRSGSSKKFDMTFPMSAFTYQSRALIWREYLDFTRKTTWKGGGPDCNITFKLDPLDSAVNTLKMDVRVPSLVYAGRGIKEGSANLSLKGNELTLNECVIKTPDGDEFKAHGELNTDKATATGTLEATVSTKTLRSLLATRNAGAASKLRILSPVHLRFDVKEHALHSKRLKAFVHLETAKLKFGEAMVENLSCDGSVDDDRISISDGKLLIDGIKLKLTAASKLSSKSMDIDTHIFGPPVFVPKLMSANSSRLIKDILERFTFPRKNEDVDLTAQIHASWDGEVFYMVTGNVVMKDFKYYRTHFDSGDASFILDSNGLLLFHNVYLYQKNGWVKTNLLYILTKGIDYHVKSPFFKSHTGPMDKFATDFAGVISAQDVLNCISPDWRSDIVDLSGLADVKASGVIDFLDMGKTRFDVDVKNSSCVWNGLPITDLAYELRVRNMDMAIQNVKGKVFGGDLTLDYASNFKTSKGCVSLKLTDAAFSPLARKIGWNLKDGDGLISLTVDAKLEDDESKRILLYGKGHADVSNANLWEVPVIRYFGKKASKWTGNDWGLISALTADFKFEGDHITTDNIRTNGKIIALKGEGEYYWRTKNYDFIVTADVFKMPFSMFMPKKFNPLTRRIVRRNGETSIERISKSPRNRK